MVVAFSATIGVLGALVLGSAVGSITSVIVYIVLALFIAVGLDPVVRRLQNRGMKRGAAIGLVFAGFAVLVAAFVVFLVPPVVSQFVLLLRAAPDAIAAIPTSDWFGALSTDMQLVVRGAVENIAVALARPETIAAVGTGVLAVGAGVASAITGGFVVVALTLYFLASLTQMKQAFYSLAAARVRPRLAEMTERVTASIGNSLIGSVILSALNSTVVFLSHLLIGLPFPALMAVIAFVVTLIPLFGSVIFLIFATAVALFSSPAQALTFGLIYLVYIQLESYVISPRVMNRAISIPAALVLIGAMIGGTLMGVLGVLVALPVMASGLLILREVVIPKQDRKTGHPPGQAPPVVS